MTNAQDIIRWASIEVCRPWMRHNLTHDHWTALGYASLTDAWTLLGYWADTLQAHALFLDPEALTIVPVSTPVEAGHYPALSPFHPGAAWYERMILDLWGHVAVGGTDARPWLDHGTWPHIRPMSTRPEQRAAVEPLTVFSGDQILSPDQAAVHDQIEAMVLPLGPVWGRLDEAAHLRLTLNGPAIRRAEALLGFTHKGTLTLMRGKSPRAAARFAARLCGDATVAHSIAFAHAAESAMDVEVPPRATAMRIIMMEIERVAGHLDNLTEVGRLTGSQLIQTRCGALREILLRASDAAFGHRLMMDCVVPGGVAIDIAEGSAQVILRALGDIASQLESIRRLHDAPALASRLSGLGRAGAKLTAALGAGGVVGRASGRAFDVRTVFAPGYGGLAPRLATRTLGDAAARQHLRIFEIGESLRLISAALDALPDGPITVALPQVSGEGIGCAESVRGDVWHWLRLDHGQIATAFARDPGWALWPLAERVLETSSADDVDLIRASFALPASGMDL